MKAYNTYLQAAVNRDYRFPERIITQRQVGWLDGVVVTTQNGLVRFDPPTRRNHPRCVFISHAHGDHVGGLSLNVCGYLTAETRDILSKRRPNEDFKHLVSLKYGDKVTVDGLKVAVHNSGHIMGSSQFEINDGESTIVYTGDVNCREMLTTKAAKAIPCDVLILETTYGNPFYVFPDLIDIHTRIIQWAIDEIRRGRTPTFRVYSVGKAQEIVKIFNTFTKIPVVTSHSVARINEAYNANDIELTYADATTKDGTELLTHPCVQVISPREKPPTVNRCSFAVATGWALRFTMASADAAFPLSSHADFNQLAQYVQRAKPKEVFTIHGFKEDFAEYLTKHLGIKAREIPPIKQSSLRAFM